MIDRQFPGFCFDLDRESQSLKTTAELFAT